VVRCGLKLSQTIAIRVEAGYRERRYRQNLRLQVQRAELIHAEDHLRVAVTGGRLAVGDRVQLLDPRLLLLVLRVFRGFPGFQPLTLIR
jgi:hypothetical protein